MTRSSAFAYRKFVDRGDGRGVRGCASSPRSSRSSPCSGWSSARAAAGLSWAFFTAAAEAGGRGGRRHRQRARRHAATWSAWPALIGLPLGVGAGVYLAEQGDGTLGNAVRFMAEVLSGVPSIVLGIVAYGAGGHPDGPLLRARRRGRAGDPHDPHPRPRHRGDGAAGAQLAARGLARAGRARLEDQPPGRAADGAGRHRHRAACSPSPAPPARPRRCSSPRSTTSTGTSNPGAADGLATVQIYNYAISPYDDWHAKAWSRRAGAADRGRTAEHRLTPADPESSEGCSMTPAPAHSHDPRSPPGAVDRGLPRRRLGESRTCVPRWRSTTSAYSRTRRRLAQGAAAARCMAVIGPSGCGKSTFLRCLNRMHELIPGARVEGKVLLDGTDIYARAWTRSTCAAGWGWSSRSPTPSPPCRSTTTWPPG